MLWLELLAPETIEVPPRPRFSRILLTFGRYKRHRTTEKPQLILFKLQ